MDEKETNVVDAEIVGEEKKNNVFSKWWQKTKKNISDGMLEKNLDDAYAEANDEYKLYVYGKNCIENVLTNGITLYGKQEGNRLVLKTEEEIPLNSVIASEDTKKVYYVASTEKVTVSVPYEGTSYDRAGVAVILDDNVEEVNVIKVGGKYYRYKG